jgi:osmoprotectant transport system substrate-binding protein
VERRPGLSDRQDALEQLAAGTVSVVPERSHALLAELTAPATPAATTTGEQLVAIGDALPAGVTVLTPSSAYDNEVVACRQRVVDKYELTTRSDLDQLLGDRPDDVSEDDCRTVPATDPAIERDNLVALVDDQLDTPLEALVPLVSTDVATPELQATLDALSSTLEPATLPLLIGQLRFDGDDARDVARDWLEAVDLT